jgi:hypothetical protein
MKKRHIILLALLPLTSIAGEPPLKLSEPTRKLLKEEMTQLQAGMQSLVLDIAAANWNNIARTGHNIKNSYILKQKLSDKQMHELHMALPDAFQTLDHKFHYYAGMLSHAAKEHDMELVQFFRYKMNESCTTCHAQFATHTFGGFKQHNRHEQQDH